MVLPVIKLGSLFVRTMSKPFATRLKQAAAYHPKFRGLIINLAQGYHRLTTMMQRHTLGRSSGLEIRPLNEERAVEAATDLMRELFVFSVSTVSGLAILFEVQRNTRAEAKKEELRKQQLEVMKQRNEALAAEMTLLRQRMEQLEMAAKQRRNTPKFWPWSWRACENPKWEMSNELTATSFFQDLSNRNKMSEMHCRASILTSKFLVPYLSRMQKNQITMQLSP
ncbi:hypothetical protein C2S51_036655 [Perilla frutescens var. frutescens]|nr:hypothetical protein C2S51_036655 [Perilla frutescens var. frutescens]